LGTASNQGGNSSSNDSSLGSIDQEEVASVVDHDLCSEVRIVGVNNAALGIASVKAAMLVVVEGRAGPHLHPSNMRNKQNRLHFSKITDILDPVKQKTRHYERVSELYQKGFEWVT
jgi:hypothetical protein